MFLLSTKPWLTIVIVVALLCTGMGAIPRVSSNPIPAPTIFLYSEDMMFNFTKLSNGTVHVAFYGKYTMENIYYGSTVHMYFPVPNKIDWDTVHVYVDGIEVSTGKTWTMMLPDGSHTYDTAYGPLPLVEWYIHNKTGKFTVEVYYNYTFSLLNGAGYTIYALGTGKYYYTYSKQCIAHVTADYNGFENTLVRATYLHPFTGEKKYIRAIWINSNHKIDDFYLLSGMFTSFTDDLLFEFEPVEPMYNYTEINEFLGELIVENSLEYREYVKITITAHVEPGKPVILGLVGYADEERIVVNITIGSTKTEGEDNLTIKSDVLVPSWKRGLTPRILLIIINNETILNNTINFSLYQTRYQFKLYKKWTPKTNKENQTIDHEKGNESIPSNQTSGPTSTSITTNIDTAEAMPLPINRSLLPVIAVILVLLVAGIILYAKKIVS